MARQNRKVGNRNRGFTLIELMMAMVILSLGLFSIIHLQVVSLRGNSYAREYTEAYQIALGVIEEIKARSVAWSDVRNGTPLTFEQVFPDINLLSEAPEYNDSITLDSSLQAAVRYMSPSGDSGYPNNEGINNLAEDSSPLSAKLVNLNGISPLDSPGIQSSRAIYRVHYVAHQVRLETGEEANPNLVRITVFVSWDNKDHGDRSIDWGDYFASEKFWKRHVVAMSIYLARTIN